MKNKEKLIEFLKTKSRNEDGVFFIPYYEMEEFAELVKDFISANSYIEGGAKRHEFAFYLDEVLEFYDITNEELA